MSDIAVRFGFVPDGEGKEPAMGLYNVRQSGQAQWAIPLSAAFKYTDQEYLMRTSFAIAQYLGMFPDAFLINRIADTILNNLDALIKQKPAGKGEGRAFGEGKMMVDGETIGEFEAYTNGDIVR
jgi:hypothetical protein